MQQSLEPAATRPTFQIQENDILADMEAMVGGAAAARSDQEARDAKQQHGRARGRWSPLVLITALAITAVLIPAGVKTGDLLVRATHHVASN